MKFEKYLLANIEKQQNTLKISLLFNPKLGGLFRGLFWGGVGGE